MEHKIIHGDCLEVMKTFPDNYFSGVVTDPPYGIKFDNRKWDNKSPNVECWKECLRIIKPGAYIVAFGGTRSYHTLASNIENAGFEIRDVISWIYLYGIPKGKNNYGLEGCETTLKPAQELCCLAMKPLDGTYKQNVEKWGLGGLNIDKCRIGASGGFKGIPNGKTIKMKNTAFGKKISNGCLKINKGKYPKNLIFDDGSCDELSKFFYCLKPSQNERRYGLNESDVTHPTVKPLDLMRYLITLISTSTNPFILDPFSGSGSTIIACKKLGINAIGIEISENYVEISKKRLNAHDP